MIDGQAEAIRMDVGAPELVPPMELLLRSLVIAGFHLSHVKQRLPDRYRTAMLHLLDLYDRRKIQPRIDSVWTFHQVRMTFMKRKDNIQVYEMLHQVAEASKRLSCRKNIGKVILIPGRSPITGPAPL